MSEDQTPEDPLNLDPVDQQIRIEKLKSELEELAGGEAVFGAMPDIDPSLEEGFLEQVLAFERGPFDTDFNRLVQSGIELPPADLLTDSEISAKLGQVIEALLKLRIFLEDTNHLSDRELYSWLCSEGLREEKPDMSGDTTGGWHLSPIGSGSDEDNLIYLKYYASEKMREEWRRQFPGNPLPPHENPPFDRDAHLPQRENY